MTDLWLTIAHHVLVFGLVAMLAAEAVLLRPGMNAGETARLARLDAGYGATAGLVVIVGILRVMYGAKGYAYYVDNPWFWAKMGSFALVALLSLPPTLRFLAWRNRLKINPAFAPAAEEVRGIRLYLRLELLLILAVLTFAAIMARFTRF